MRTTAARAAAAAWLVALAAATPSPAGKGKEQPSAAPVPQDSIVQGCFSSAGELVFVSSEKWNSRGKCGVEICQKMNKNVAASTNGRDCYCGDKYPPKATLSDDSNCNIPCTGFGDDACGGNGYWTVYNTGLELYKVDYSGESATPSAVVTVQGGQTVFVTQTSNSDGAKPGPNTAGIAAGVVVGLVALAGIAGGAFFFIRRRRNAQIEEEHRRNAAVSSFIGSGKPPSSSGDSRLDPMAHRRLSDGSIADNEDYSRKILRVTNA